MKAISRACTLTLGAGVFVTLFLSQASAGCGDITNWQGPFAMARTSLEAPSAVAESAKQRSAQSQASIVGIWSIQFVSLGNTAHNPSIPDGALLDFGYQIWHSDGTEFMNSGGRAPATQNFCEGVWGQTGFNTFELNHFAFSYNATTGANAGTVNIREQVTLSPSGDSYGGTFTIDAYDTSGFKLDHVAGTIAAARVTVDTTVTAQP
jgi:hypothetical protein